MIRTNRAASAQTQTQHRAMRKEVAVCVHGACRAWCVQGVE